MGAEISRKLRKVVPDDEVRPEGWDLDATAKTISADLDDTLRKLASSALRRGPERHRARDHRAQALTQARAPSNRLGFTSLFEKLSVP